MSFEFVTARTVLEDKTLYKYKSLADQSKGYTYDILLNNKIRFAKPSELNNPMEGKPIYVLGNWSSTLYRSKYERWAWSTQNKHVENKPIKSEFKKWFRSLTKQDHEIYVNQIVNQNQEIINKKWKILSLSATSKSTLMWSHYSDSHKGIAYIFDASKGEIGLAFKVFYVPERPCIDIISSDENKVLHATILSKIEQWKYEEEFRVIGAETGEFGPIKLHSQFYHFSESVLTGVIFGACTSEDDKREIYNIASKRKTPFRFMQAYLDSKGNVNIKEHKKI